MKSVRSGKHDNRSCLRFKCRGIVLYRPLHRDEYRKGVVVDYCDHGLCVIADHPVKPGSGIYLRIAGQTEAEPLVRTRPRTVAMAEVKRCEEIKVGLGLKYRLGLKYFVSS